MLTGNPGHAKSFDYLPATENEFGIFAYCFMPDHVHLLVEGLADRSHAVTFIDRAKQYSGYYFKRTFGTKLWQRCSARSVLARSRPGAWT